MKDINTMIQDENKAKGINPVPAPSQPKHNTDSGMSPAFEFGWLLFVQFGTLAGFVYIFARMIFGW